MMNNSLIFAETYMKEDANNNSLHNGAIRSNLKVLSNTLNFNDKRKPFLFKKITKTSLNQSDIVPEVKEREYPAELPGSEYKMELVWRNIIIFFFLHAGAIYGVLVPKNSWYTVIFSKC